MEFGLRPCLTLALILLVAPQAAGSSVVDLTDPAGDLSGPRSDEPDFVDLIGASLDLNGTPQLVLRFAGQEDLEIQQAVASASYARYLVNLEYRSQPFAVSATLRDSDGLVMYWVAREGGQLTYNGTSRLTDASLKLTLPGAALSTSSGFSPSPGETVRILDWASSWDVLASSSTTFPGSPLHALDFGDVGLAEATVPGHGSDLLLKSPRPVVRANGGETTYAWDLEITNGADQDRVVSLALDGAGDARFYHPSSIELAAGETHLERVYAVLPFGHAHGKTYDFQATVSDGQVQERIDLQVLYVDPPQPAGHHDTVYLHARSGASSGGLGQTWMNTTETTPDGQAQGRFVACETGQGTEWTFPLNPALEIGIDADLNAMAALEFSLEQLAPGPDFVVQARLGIIDDETTPDVGDEFTATASWPGAGVHGMEMDLPIPPELDYVEPAPGRNFVLVVRACEGVSSGAPPLLVHNDLFEFQSGGRLVLPFHEFRPENSPRDADLSVRVDPPLVLAPPGGWASWSINVMGDGSETVVFDVVAPEEYQVSMVEGVAASFEVSMVVPEEAKPGDILDVILVASDPSATTIALRALVDPDAPFVAAPVVNSDESASGLGSAVVLVALVAFVRLSTGPGRRD